MNRVSGETGWQLELNAFNSGGGSYWVPDPGPEMTLAQLEAGRLKADQTARGIESRYSEFKSESNLGPMAQLVMLLDAKVYNYDLAIEQLQQGAPVETPGTETPGTGSSKNTLLLGGAAVALLLIMKKKKAVSAANKKDDKVVWWLVGGGLVLWLIMRKKAELVQVDPQPGEPIESSPVPQPVENILPDVVQPVEVVPVKDTWPDGDPIQYDPWEIPAGPEPVPGSGGGGGAGYYPEPGQTKELFEVVNQYT